VPITAGSNRQDGDAPTGPMTRERFQGDQRAHDVDIAAGLDLSRAESG